MRDFSAVRSRRVSHDVINQILDRIKSGELQEGDVLPAERVLAAQMEVSRPTVSSALDALAGAGIVRSGQGRSGNAEIVSIWIPDGLEEIPAGAEQISPEIIFRLLEARRTVEPRVAQLAALRATDQHFAAMEESIVLLEKNQNDLTKAAQAESLFHRIMWRASDNKSLIRMMKQLMLDLRPVHDMMMRTPEDYAAAIDLHSRTLSAMKSGDPDFVEAEMILHLQHFEQIVESVLEQNSQRKVPSFLAR